MKKCLFAVILCMILVVSMVPTWAFADDTGDTLSQGLYWRRTQRSHNESGDMVFEAIEDPLNEPIVGEPNNDAIQEFIYVDEKGTQSIVRFAELHFSGSCYDPDPMPSKNDGPDSDEREWTLVSLSFTKVGEGTVTYGDYSIRVICQEPDYEFRAYDIEAEKAGEPIEHWDWAEDNNTICFVANNGCSIKSFVENTDDALHSSHLGPVITPAGGLFPTTLVAITLEEEPKEKELEILFNDISNSITIRVSSGSEGDPGLFWRVEDDADWTKEPITGKCGSGAFRRFIFRDVEGHEERVSADKLSTESTFFKFVVEGPGIDFDFKSAGRGELIYTNGDTNYKIEIVVEHNPTDPIVEDKVDATCKAEGSYDEVIYCKGCDAEISRTKKTIEKLAHTPTEAVKENEVAATCKAEGSYDEVVYCSGCKEEISRTKKTIEKLAHTPAEAVKENEVAATCKAEGSYDEVVYCGECKEELSRETKTIEKLTEHIWGEWVKNEAGTEQTHTCTVCGETETEATPGGGSGGNASGGGGHSGGSTPRPSEPAVTPEDPAEDTKETVKVEVTDPVTGETTEVEVPKAAADAAKQFEDVEPTDYFAEAVGYAAENGITAGVSAGKFGPAKDCTRGQVVTFLWTAHGKHAPEKASDFADIAGSAYYADAVAWAVENGITAGTSKAQFSPDRTVTRGQFITMLWVSMGKPEVTETVPFTDVPEDAYYAKAVAWAYANGITAGKSATAFGADDPCTRGQIVTFLYNAIVE